MNNVMNNTLENANSVLNNAFELLQAGKKGCKAQVSTAICEAMGLIRKAIEENQPKVDQKAEDRKKLQELSKTLRQHAENAGIRLSNNQLLYGYYTDKGATRLATIDSWENKGAKVHDDAKPYLFWGKMEVRYTIDGKKYNYYPLEYRYDIKDVTFIEDDIAEGEVD